MQRGWGWHLARHLGLLVPDAGLGVLPGYGQGWLSRFLTGAVDFEMDPRITNLHDLGGVLAVDVAVANEDRHADNLLRVVDIHGSQTIHPIDWDRAAVSRPERYSSYGVAGALDGSALPAGLDFRPHREAALAAAIRLAGLSLQDVMRRAEDTNLHARLPTAHAPAAVGQFLGLIARSNRE